ncbi:MAG: dTDP-4-dehydrorhamnose 3,5-epimerase [Planctomycetaceae bacterium]|nr:dTDP-4-dehydrorhamnose 3,5-epimerase [Planctomycetaceae bacterium]
MQIEETDIPGVRVITPRIFRDPRGLFLETWQREKFAAAGLDVNFVQDNFSQSTRGTLRGLHYQIQQPQGKLVHVTRGKVMDVAVDLRRSSPAFGRHVAVELSSDDHRMLYVPPGCAHGFLVLSEDVDFCYRCTDYYAPQAERTLLWNDPAIGIEWPIDDEPLLSDKDKLGKPLAEADCYP